MPDPTLQEKAPPARRTALEVRRARAIDAFIDLVLEGGIPPSSEQVAERAGISMATLFRYFDSLDQLRLDATRRVKQRFAPLFRLEGVGRGPLPERIRRLVAHRIALWEQVHPLTRLDRSASLFDPGAEETIELGRRAMADQIRAHFEPELRARTPAEREDAVVTIASLTSVESWEQFRQSQGRSAMQTRRAWSRALERILEVP